MVQTKTRPQEDLFGFQTELALAELLQAASNAMNTRAIMQSHWVAFLFLVPGGVMLLLHHWLGLSDALNMPTPPGEREAHLFNWIMATVFWLGVAAFALHTFSLWSRGWRWVWAKLILFGLYWGAILILA